MRPATAVVVMAVEVAVTDPTAPAHHGGCHCGAVQFAFRTQRPLSGFTPRACDCDFCTRHRAGWVSDAAGMLRITASDGLRRYRQESGQAEFLVCGNCGVLVAVVCAGDDGVLRGAVNRNGFDERNLFGAEVAASPQQLAPEAKLARWSQLWTPTSME
jgi:hypothetical protein